MGNISIGAWRAAIGLYYNGTHCFHYSYFFKQYPQQHLLYIFGLFIAIYFRNIFCTLGFCLLKLIFSINMFLLLFNNNLKKISQNIAECLRLFYFIGSQALFSIKKLLLLLSGDIETNPGPNNQNDACLSIIHQNIRSIRNKIDFIKDHFNDFEILCFTETHLTNTIKDDQIFLDGYRCLYRKDNTAHSGGIIIYTSDKLVTKRGFELEMYSEESIWTIVKDKEKNVLIGTVYRHPNSTVEFWSQLENCLEKAHELLKYIVLLGDVNEDQLNHSNHKLRDISIINNMSNVINQPTRVSNTSATFIDPIVISSEIKSFDFVVSETSRDE
jgi:hypothetical protein